MRTTLNLDEQALRAALKAAPGATKTSVINESLREFARRGRLKGLLALRGKVKWTGNIDKLRQRRG